VLPSQAEVAPPPPTALCHGATLVEVDGGILVAWFGGSTEGAADTAIWAAHHSTKGWSAPRMAVRGGPAACWNPVLVRTAAKRLLLFYKVGPSPTAWRGMVTSSPDDGATWAVERPLPDGVTGPARSKPLVLTNGDLLSPSSTEHDGWQVHVERSEDDGQSWQMCAIAGSPQVAAIQPCLLDHGGGRLQMLCRTRQGRVATGWSTDDGRTWSRLCLSALANPNAGFDALSLADGRHLLVRNSVASGRTPLTVAVSRDGVAWHTVLALAEGLGEFAYPAAIQTTDGLVHVVWSENKVRIRHATLDPADMPEVR